MLIEGPIQTTQMSLLTQSIPRIPTSSTPTASLPKFPPFLDETPQDVFLAQLYQAGILDSHGWVTTPLDQIPIPQVDATGLKCIKDLLTTSFDFKIVLNKKTQQVIQEKLKSLAFKENQGVQKFFRKLFLNPDNIPTFSGSFRLINLFNHLLSIKPGKINVHGGFVKIILKNWFESLLPHMGIIDEDLIANLLEQFKDMVPDTDLRFISPEIEDNFLLTFNAEITKFIANSLEPSRPSLEELDSFCLLINETICKVEEIFPKDEWGSDEKCASTGFENETEKRDILIVKNLKREHLFLLDALSVCIDTIINPSTNDSPIFPESDLLLISQAIFDRLGKLLHLDDIQNVGPKVVVRFSALLITGHRCAEKETSKKLTLNLLTKFKTNFFDRKISNKICQWILSYNKNHHHGDAKALIASSLTTLNILQRDGMDIKEVAYIWQTIQETLWTKKEQNLYALIGEALKHKPEAFQEVLACLQIAGFIHLQIGAQSGVKTKLTRHEETIHLQIIDGYTLLLPCDLSSPIDLLIKTEKNHDQVFWNLLKNIFSYFEFCIPSQPHISQLSKHLEELNIPINEIVKIGLRFLQNSNHPFFIQLSYQLLLGCYFLQPDSINPLVFLEQFPNVLFIEKDHSKRSLLLTTIQSLIAKANLPTLDVSKHLQTLIKTDNSGIKTIYLEWLKYLLSVNDLQLIDLALHVLSKMGEKKFKEYALALLNSLSPIPASAACQLFLFIQNKKGFSKGEDIKFFVTLFKQFPNDFALLKSAASKVILLQDPTHSKDIIHYIRTLCLHDPSIENLQLLTQATKLGTVFPNSTETIEAWITICDECLTCTTHNEKKIWDAWKQAIKSKVPLTNPLSLKATLFLSRLYEKLFLANESSLEECLSMFCKQNKESPKWHKDEMLQEINSRLSDEINQAVLLFYSLINNCRLDQREETDKFKKIVQICQDIPMMPYSILELLFKTSQQVIANRKVYFKTISLKQAASIPKINADVLWIVTELLKQNQHPHAQHLLSSFNEENNFQTQECVENLLNTCHSIFKAEGAASAANFWMQADKLGILNSSFCFEQNQHLFITLCQELLAIPNQIDLLKELIKHAVKMFKSDNASKHQIDKIFGKLLKKDPEFFHELSNEFHLFLSPEEQFLHLHRQLEVEILKKDFSKLNQTLSQLSLLIKKSLHDFQKEMSIKILDLLLTSISALKMDQIRAIASLLSENEFHALFLGDEKSKVEFLLKWTKAFKSKAFQGVDFIFIKTLLDGNNLSRESNLKLLDYLRNILNHSTVHSDTSLKTFFKEIIHSSNEHLDHLLTIFAEEKLLFEMFDFLQKLSLLFNQDLSLSEKSLQLVLSASIKIFSDFPLNSEMLEITHKTLNYLRCYKPPVKLPGKQMQTYVELVRNLLQQPLLSLNPHFLDFAKGWIKSILDLEISTSLPSNQLLEWFELFLLNQDFTIFDTLFNHLKNSAEISQSKLIDLLTHFATEYLLKQPLVGSELILQNFLLLLKRCRSFQCLGLVQLFLEKLLTNPKSDALKLAWYLVKDYQICTSAQLKTLFNHAARTVNLKEEMFEILEWAEEDGIFKDSPNDYTSCLECFIKTTGSHSIKHKDIIQGLSKRLLFQTDFPENLRIVILQTFLNEETKHKNQETQVFEAIIELKHLFEQKNSPQFSQELDSLIISSLIQKQTIPSCLSACKYSMDLFTNTESNEIYPRLLKSLLKIILQGVSLFKNHSPDHGELEIEQLIIKTALSLRIQHLTCEEVPEILFEVIKELLNHSSYKFRALGDFFLNKLLKHEFSQNPELKSKIAINFRYCLNQVVQSPFDLIMLMNQLTNKNILHIFSEDDISLIIEKVMLIGLTTSLPSQPNYASPLNLSVFEFFNEFVLAYQLSPSAEYACVSLALDNLLAYSLKCESSLFFFEHAASLIKNLTTIDQTSFSEKLSNNTKITPENQLIGQYSKIYDHIQNWLSIPKSEKAIYNYITYEESLKLQELDDILHLGSQLTVHMVPQPPFCPSLNTFWKCQQNHPKFIFYLTLLLEKCLSPPPKDTLDLFREPENAFFLFFVQHHLEYLISEFKQDGRIPPLIELFATTPLSYSKEFFNSHIIHARHLYIHALKAKNWNIISDFPSVAYTCEGYLIISYPNFPTTLTNENAENVLLDLFERFSKTELLLDAPLFYPDLIKHLIDVFDFLSNQKQTDFSSIGEKLFPAISALTQSNILPLGILPLTLVEYFQETLFKYALKPNFLKTYTMFLEVLISLDAKLINGNVREIPTLRSFVFLRESFLSLCFKGKYISFYNLLNIHLPVIINASSVFSGIAHLLFSTQQLEVIFTTDCFLKEDERMFRAFSFNRLLDTFLKNPKPEIVQYSTNLFNEFYKNGFYDNLDSHLSEIKTIFKTRVGISLSIAEGVIA